MDSSDILVTDDEAPLVEEVSTIKTTGLFGCVSCRHFLAFMNFLGFMCVSACRVCFTIALVSMTKAGDNVTRDNVTDGECPWNNDTTNSTEPSNQHEFSWSPTVQGQLLTAFFYGYVFTQFPGGILAEKFNCKIIFGGAIVLSNALYLALPSLARYDVKLLLGLRVVMGLLQGPLYPACYAMWGRWAPEKERTKLINYSTAGLPFGTMVGYSITGYLCKSTFLGGWPAAFYLWGILTCLWMIPWMILVHETPESHPRISQEELTLIVSATGHATKQQYHTPSWKAMLSSKAVWAILLSYFFDGIAFYGVFTSAPMYLQRVLHFDISTDGVLSGIPMLGSFIVAIAGGIAADSLRKRTLSTKITRILFTALGCGSIVISFIVIILAGCDRVLSVTALTTGMTLLGLQGGGVSANALDIAPMYAGTLLGIANTLGNVGGFIAPTMAEAFTGFSISRTRWTPFYIVCVSLYLLEIVVFSLLAEGKVQDFAKTDIQSDKIRTNSDGQDCDEDNQSDIE